MMLITSHIKLLLVLITIYAFAQYAQKSNRIHLKKVQDIANPYFFNHAH